MLPGPSRCTSFHTHHCGLLAGGWSYVVGVVPPAAWSLLHVACATGPSRTPARGALPEGCPASAPPLGHQAVLGPELAWSPEWVGGFVPRVLRLVKFM